MKTINELFESLKKVNYDLQSIIRDSHYRDCDDLSYLVTEDDDPEQLLLLDECRSMMQKLEEVSRTIDYLKRPIVYSGVLSKNKGGRYELKNGRYFTSGNGIECLITDDYHEKYVKEKNDYIKRPYWAVTRVEHDGEDYYLVGYKNIPLEGLTVRIRG